MQCSLPYGTIVAPLERQCGLPLLPETVSQSVKGDRAHLADKRKPFTAPSSRHILGELGAYQCRRAYSSANQQTDSQGRVGEGEGEQYRVRWWQQLASSESSHCEKQTIECVALVWRQSRARAARLTRSCCFLARPSSVCRHVRARFRA